MLWFGLLFLGYTLSLSNCQSELSERSEGERLAKTRCASCHLFPEPELLTKAIWEESVLPQMAYFFGIHKNKLEPYSELDIEEYKAVKAANLYPEEASITAKEWTKIVQYYIQNAPEEVSPIKNREPVALNLSLFEPQPIHLKLKGGPLSIMVAYDSTNYKILFSDLRDTLYQLNHLGNLEKKTNGINLTSDIHVRPDGSMYLLAIGNINPKDIPLGKLLYQNLEGKIEILLEDLHRPVDLEVGDLNQDGKEDLVICTYGHNVGQFAWYEQIDSMQFKAHQLSNLPGAIKSYIQDMNGDHLPDIITLMGQGDEGITIYYNEGNNNFKAEKVLRFQPLYGSSYFDLVDYEGDGDLDILLANGDNADYSAIPKKYHGLRLFLNDGNNQFEEAFFYPMYGSTKALLYDFDGDGDKDIAAIAYFPEYDKALEEGFVYLENTESKSFQFKASTFPNAALGRWIVMDRGDFDQDQDEDLIIGSLFYAPTPSPPQLKSQLDFKWPKCTYFRKHKSVINFPLYRRQSLFPFVQKYIHLLQLKNH